MCQNKNKYILLNKAMMVLVQIISDGKYKITQSLLLYVI